MPFNSVTALGMHNNKAINPLVNCGAMASVSLVKANGFVSAARDHLRKAPALAGQFEGRLAPTGAA